MSLFTQLLAFLKTTLLSFQAFLLWLFVPSPTLHSSAVTPYPLRPDLEGRVIDISYAGPNSVSAAQSGTGILARASNAGRLRAVSAPPTRADASKTPRTDSSQSKPTSVLPIYHSRVASGSIGKASSGQEQGNRRPLPLITNVDPRLPGSSRKHNHISSRTLVYAANDENLFPPALRVHDFSEAFDDKTRDGVEDRNRTPPRPKLRLLPQNPTPLKPMSRYLNLTESSPSKATTTTCEASSARNASESHPRRRSIVGRNRRDSFDAGRDIPTPASPLGLEASISDGLKNECEEMAVDFAARVRSVFYRCRLDSEKDEDCEAVRNVFNRNSVCSWLGLGRDGTTMGERKSAEDDANCEEDIADCVNEEDEYDRDSLLGIRALRLLPSSSSVLSTSRSSLTLQSSPGLGSKFSGAQKILVPIHVPSSTLSQPQPIPFSLNCSVSSSELSYLRNTVVRLSSSSIPSSSSSSSTVSSRSTFNDLLASVESKYPGTHWADIIQFSASGEDAELEDTFTSLRFKAGDADAYGGIFGRP